MMKRLFSFKKKKAAPPPPSVEEASEKMNKRGDVINEKIKKLDAELCIYKEQLKSTRPGPSQNAIKARAMRVLKQKKMYEGQRDMLYNQAFSLDQVSFASEGIKDAQHTIAAMRVGNKELTGTMKRLTIDDVDRVQEDIQDLAGYSSEMQESLVGSYTVPDDLDEEELMGELGGLENDMLSEIDEDQMPAYLQPEKAAESEADLKSPSASFVHGTPTSQSGSQCINEQDLPTTPKVSSIKL